MNQEIESKPLIGVLHGYVGQCHNCGGVIRCDYILVSDMGEVSDRGDPMFLLIGVLDKPDSIVGHRVVCPDCLNPMIYLQLYINPIDVTEQFAGIAHED